MDKIEVFYSNENTRLYNGNCLEIMQKMPAETFDMVFADPPYFLIGGRFTCQNGQMVSVKKGDWDIGKTAEENFKFHLEWLKCKK